MRFFKHRVPKLLATCIFQLIHTWLKLLMTPLLQPLTGVAQVLGRKIRGNGHLPFHDDVLVLKLPLRRMMRLP